MLYGYTGKILHVDLTAGVLEVERPDESFYRQYCGGSLMGMYYLWKNTPKGADALSPQNTLTFAVGPAAGLPVSGQSRCSVTCKSPSSGGVADAQAGGFWPAELKFAGFDAIVVRGASETPVYLNIKDGGAELKDASHLWGMTSLETEQKIKAELGDEKTEIAEIGPAGEKMANFAAIMNMANRAWGRTGVGAVMGSKKLKAIAVRGSQKVNVADKKRLMALAKQGVKDLAPTGMDEFGRYGTIGVVAPQQAAGGLPTNNWNAGTFDSLEEAEAIDGQTLYDAWLRGAQENAQDKRGRDTCYACIVRCKRVIEAEYKEHKLIPEYGGPEYETAAGVGSYCGVSDMGAMAYANQLCNAYGVDSISIGGTIAWAMELFENGLLTAEDTDGIELRFGNADAMVAMLERTLKREGFGDILANGSRKAADILGKGHEYLVQIKGQELPAHMPQVKRSLGLIYAVNPFGADHQSSEHDPGYSPKGYEAGGKRYLEQLGLTDPQPSKAMNAEKVNFALTTQYSVSATDSISVCQFVYGASWQLYTPKDMAELMSAVTGWEITVDDIQAIGRKRVNFMRAFNAREGLSRQDDTLPYKVLNQALVGGRSDGLVVPPEEFEGALDMYFEQANWNPSTGVPTRASLEAADLAWLAEELAVA